MTQASLLYDSGLTFTQEEMSACFYKLLRHTLLSPPDSYLTKQAYCSLHIGVPQ